jgi:putative ABC transport system ATP-binding protein
VLAHTNEIRARFSNSLEKTVNEPIIHVENVHKSFLMGKEAVQALRGVDLDVMPGDMVCLMGPSGSGKTTLLNILGGLEEPSRGHVVVDGQNVVALSEDELARLRLRTMGFVFQNYNLLANFTALENVESPMALAGLRGRRRRQKATDLLQLVGLGDRADHYPTELSGGQQQRVAIARALANDPAILIGDEITGDLDSVTGFEVMRLVTQLNHERGTTVIYVTHDPRMAEYARRLIEIRDGRLVSDQVHDTTLADTETLSHDQGPADADQSTDDQTSSSP